MTAIELITELAKFSPHMSVEMRIYDEQDGYPSMEVVEFVKKETDEDGREFILIV